MYLNRATGDDREEYAQTQCTERERLVRVPVKAARKVALEPWTERAASPPK